MFFFTKGASGEIGRPGNTGVPGGKGKFNVYIKLEYC
jgi:hypothetical protein